MTRRPVRYLQAIVWLVGALLPLAYGAFGLILFWTPQTPRSGFPTILDWISAALSLAVVVAVLVGLTAYLSQRFRLAWTLLGLAYLPLLLVQALQLFSR